MLQRPVTLWYLRRSRRLRIVHARETHRQVVSGYQNQTRRMTRELKHSDINYDVSTRRSAIQNPNSLSCIYVVRNSGPYYTCLWVYFAHTRKYHVVCITGRDDLFYSRRRGPTPPLIRLYKFQPTSIQNAAMHARRSNTTTSFDGVLDAMQCRHYRRGSPASISVPLCTYSHTLTT